MRSRWIPRYWIPPVALAWFAVMALGGCGASSESELASVPTRYVCMVNDKFFGTDQIPVTVADQTYYGCCAGCEKTLRENRSVRFAIDPVSGREVDKATAAIGALPDGRVYYFEHKKNLRKFRTQTAS